MSNNTTSLQGAEVIGRIADIQISAISKIADMADSPNNPRSELIKLMGITKSEISAKADTLINLYTQLQRVPETLTMLDEYQLGICSHILFKMEDEWIQLELTFGVNEVWHLIHESYLKFHPEFRLIL